MVINIFAQIKFAFQPTNYPSHLLKWNEKISSLFAKTVVGCGAHARLSSDHLGGKGCGLDTFNKLGSNSPRRLFDEGNFRNFKWRNFSSSLKVIVKELSTLKGETIKLNRVGRWQMWN